MVVDEDGGALHFDTAEGIELDKCFDLIYTQILWRWIDVWLCEKLERGGGVDKARELTGCRVWKLMHVCQMTCGRAAGRLA